MISTSTGQRAYSVRSDEAISYCVLYWRLSMGQLSGSADHRKLSVCACASHNPSPGNDHQYCVDTDYICARVDFRFFQYFTWLGSSMHVYYTVALLNFHRECTTVFKNSWHGVNDGMWYFLDSGTYKILSKMSS